MGITATALLPYISRPLYLYIIIPLRLSWNSGPFSAPTSWSLCTSRATDAGLLGVSIPIEQSGTNFGFPPPLSPLFHRLPWPQTENPGFSSNDVAVFVICQWGFASRKQSRHFEIVHASEVDSGCVGIGQPHAGSCAGGCEDRNCHATLATRVIVSRDTLRGVLHFTQRSSLPHENQLQNQMYQSRSDNFLQSICYATILRGVPKCNNRF
jgi:hypothetical protein